MRIAITGASGRLGTALVKASTIAGEDVVGWDRTDFDLDTPWAIGGLLDEAQPDLLVHAAAWTDVDGCARDPLLALARNGRAAGTVAEASAARGIAMIFISTNEVFDGERSDGRPYEPHDRASPANAYGRSKLDGEQRAQAAFEDAGAWLAIVRTAWLFGGGRPDFPARIAEAARIAAADRRPLRVVADEIGTPTFVADLASVVVRIAGAGVGGLLHIVNGGVTSRAQWAGDVVRRLGIEVRIEDIALDDYERPSRPPKWGVLAPSSIPGPAMRHWQAAMEDRMALGGLNS